MRLRNKSLRFQVIIVLLFISSLLVYEKRGFNGRRPERGLASRQGDVFTYLTNAALLKKIVFIESFREANANESWKTRIFEGGIASNSWYFAHRSNCPPIGITGDGYAVGFARDCFWALSADHTQVLLESNSAGVQAKRGFQSRIKVVAVSAREHLQSVLRFGLPACIPGSFRWETESEFSFVINGEGAKVYGDVRRDTYGRPTVIRYGASGEPNDALELRYDYRKTSDRLPQGWTVRASGAASGHAIAQSRILEISIDGSETNAGCFWYEEFRTRPLMSLVTNGVFVPLPPESRPRAVESVDKHAAAKPMRRYLVLVTLALVHTFWVLGIQVWTMKSLGDHCRRVRSGLLLEKAIRMSARGVASAGYTIAFLALTGGLDHLYSRSPYHWLQASAILRGELALGHDITQLQHDLAWYNGSVHQVWGLGVGMWIALFEGLYRSMGGFHVPERIAIAAAVFGYSLYTTNTAIALGLRFRRKALACLISMLFHFYAPMWVLALGPQLVYEETVLFACLVTNAILIAAARAFLFQRTVDYLLCWSLCSFVSFVRPTHLVYAVLAFCMTFTVGLIHHSQKTSPCSTSRRSLLMGSGVFLVGILLLLVTNYNRFGSCREFGHRLTISSKTIVFITRFRDAAIDTSKWYRVKELFGWLFLEESLRRNAWSDPDVVRLQAPEPLWRDMYLPNFGVGHLIATIVALLLAVRFLLLRMTVSRRGSILLPENASVLFLLIWSVGSFVGLFVFYLGTGGMSSRYVMDFAPGLLGVLLVPVTILGVRCSRGRAALVAVAMLVDLSRTRLSPNLNPPTHLPSASELLPLPGRSLAEYGGRYHLDAHPGQTARWNGQGWDVKGEAGPVVSVAVDKPEFVEILVGERIGFGNKSDTYRARIGLCELPLRGVESSKGALRVRFEVPPFMQTSEEPQLLFLCFSKSLEPLEHESRRLLYSISWR